MAINNDGLFTWSRGPVENFKKGLHNNSKYNDPTYLGFVLLFDWTTPHTQTGNGGSPLLAGGVNEAMEGNSPEGWTTKPGTAMDYLKRCGEYNRMRYLNAFINTLKTVNYQMPWYWQEIEGLDTAWNINKLADPYIGGDDAVIKIKTLESIDLIITKCMDLYRNAIYDWEHRRVIIPENLRKFTVYIHVQEIRKFQIDSLFMDKLKSGVPGMPGAEGFQNTSMGGKFSDAMSDKNSGPDSKSNKINNFFGGVDNEDSQFINEAGAKVTFELQYCEFNADASNIPFSELSMGSAEHASQTLEFSYENKNKMGTYPSLNLNVENQSGNVGGEAKSKWKSDLEAKGKQIAANAVQSAADKVKGKLAGLVLGNVHGFSAGNLASALEQGTIQGISSEIGQAASLLNKKKGNDLTGKQNAHR